VYRALSQYGAPLDGLSLQDFRDGSTFQIGQPPARVDILQRIDGLTFDEAWQNRIEGLIDGEVQINVISKDDLVRNKLASGLEQDLLDVKKLRAAAEPDSAALTDDAPASTPVSALSRLFTTALWARAEAIFPVRAVRFNGLG
jgi:hypothetical protein